MEFLFKYLNKYCLIIGRVFTKHSTRSNLWKTPVKTIKHCIQDFPT